MHKKEPKPVEDIFKIITDKFISLLEKGVVPWQQPWKSSFSFPANFYTGKEYRGINVILLTLAGFSSPYWLTERQAGKLGGRVKENEVGSCILFWGRYRVQKKSSVDAGYSRFRKSYAVYNSTQCEGIPIPKENSTVFNPIEKCERIINEMQNKPKISHGGNSAYYQPLTDRIGMPDKNAFESEQEYYCTLFHELCHATGHETRLNRKSIKDIKPFGSEDYSKEELIAEIGAAFLCGLTSIENKTINNSAAYIQGWLKRLQNDKSLVIIAAQQAQKAVDYIRREPTPEELRQQATLGALAQEFKDAGMDVAKETLDGLYKLFGGNSLKSFP